MALRDAIESVLEHDPILLATVGWLIDEVTGVRIPNVYELVANRSANPPFVVWQILPGGEPAGHYGDQTAVENGTVQITGWGRTNDEAWTVFNRSREAMEHGRSVMEIESIPYDFLTFQYTGDAHSLPDPDTNFVQVPSTWRVVTGR